MRQCIYCGSLATNHACLDNMPDEEELMQLAEAKAKLAEAERIRASLEKNMEAFKKQFGMCAELKLIVKNYEKAVKKKQRLEADVRRLEK